MNTNQYASMARLLETDASLERGELCARFITRRRRRLSGRAAAGISALVTAVCALIYVAEAYLF